MSTDGGVPFEPSPERLREAIARRRRGRRFGWLLGAKIFPRVKVSSSLKFYHQVLGLEHLNYGLWANERRDLDGLRAAQQRYIDTLCTWIPPGVRTVLDVGCGTGGTCLKLREMDLEVEGLSPDPYHEEIFTARTDIPFHLSRFELFRSARPFDLVLMSESAQFVMLDQLFRNVMRVAPGGYLLVSDYFRLDAEAADRSGHLWEDFLDEAERWGFEIARREDITSQVLPTLELAAGWLDRYVNPTLEILRDSLAARHPRLARVALRVVRRGIPQLSELNRLADQKGFQEGKRYWILLFKAPAA